MTRYLMKEYRHLLTRQQVTTINGQSKVGNEEGALKGLIKILKRQGVKIEDIKLENGATYSIYK